MKDKLEALICALREELQQYGEMLARLDFHQQLVIRRDAERLLQSIADVETQGAVIQNARQRREECQRALGRFLELGGSASLAVLNQHVPEDYRPLLSALVQENNELLVRIQQRSRQNHLLLAKMVEMMERVLGTLCAGTANPLYNQAGAVHGCSSGSRGLYEAVG